MIIKIRVYKTNQEVAEFNFGKENDAICFTDIVERDLEFKWWTWFHWTGAYWEFVKASYDFN